MRIGVLLISTGWAGAENVVHNLIESLPHEMERYLLINEEIYRYYSSIQNAQIKKLGPVYHTKKIVRPFYYYRICQNIKRIVKENRIELMHLHLKGSFIAYKPLFDRLPIPTIVTLHGDDIRELYLGESSFIDNFCTKFALKKAAHITCVSNNLKNFLKDSGLCDLSKVSVIYNGVNVREIQRCVDKKLGEKITLLYIGRLIRKKGVDLLIQAMQHIIKELHDIELHIIGAGEMESSLRKQSNMLGLNNFIHFHGFIPSPELYFYYNSADICIFPSRDESFGVVALEAMAAGKPIVATNVGGIPEIITLRRNGFLVNPDPKEIADAVIFLCQHPEIREKMSQNNQVDVLKYDWSGIVDSYAKLYESVISDYNIRVKNL